MEFFSSLLLGGESAVSQLTNCLVDAEENGIVSPGLSTLTWCSLAATKSVSEGTFLGVTQFAKGLSFRHFLPAMKHAIGWKSICSTREVPVEEILIVVKDITLFQSRSWGSVPKEPNLASCPSHKTHSLKNSTWRQWSRRPSSVSLS